MAVNRDTITDGNQLNFSEHADILVDWLKKNWVIGKAAPKGYQAFLRKRKGDLDGMEELDEQKIMNEFKGLDVQGTLSPAFPVQMSLPHIAYSDKGQGRDPFRMMVASIFSYGILYGQKLEQVSSNSDTHFRVNHIRHCSTMGELEKNAGVKVTWRLELEETVKNTSNWSGLSKKWEKIREEIKAIKWNKLSTRQKNKIWKAADVEGRFPRGKYKTLKAEFSDYVFIKYHERTPRDEKIEKLVDDILKEKKKKGKK